MLAVGREAPEFSVTATNGATVSLKALRGRSVVLYFFRKAFTRNCTVETKGFRDNYPELRELGVEVIGVSSDDMATQCAFAREHDVTFPMIADPRHEIERKYNVLFSLIPIAHRVTYVIDPEGVIAAVFNHEFAVNRHLDEVLRFVKGMTSPRSSRR